GLATHWLDGAAARALEPALRPSVAAGVFFAPGPHGDPPRPVPAPRGPAPPRRAARPRPPPGGRPRGARPRARGGRPPPGLCRASTVVIASGAWAGSREVLGDALAVPVRPLKGQALALRASARTGVPAHVVWTEQVHLAPKAGEKLLVGATVEECGFDAAVTAVVGGVPP